MVDRNRSDVVWWDFVANDGCSAAARSFDVANGPRALCGTPTTGAPATEAVINRPFFCFSDSSETIQEDLAVELAHRQMWIATVTDKLGAAAAYGTFNLRTPIQSNAVKPPRLKRLVLRLRSVAWCAPGPEATCTGKTSL
jgi:hypothetical protein